jgi:hypothetical protein
MSFPFFDDTTLSTIASHMNLSTLNTLSRCDRRLYTVCTPILSVYKAIHTTFYMYTRIKQSVKNMIEQLMTDQQGSIYVIYYRTPRTIELYYRTGLDQPIQRQMYDPEIPEHLERLFQMIGVYRCVGELNVNDPKLH